LRELRFPRLLSRQEFPYDARHHAQENAMGPPPLQEDLYYDVEKNQFVKLAPEIPADESLFQETVPQNPEIQQDEPVKQEHIIEFLYDIFQDGKTQQPGNNEPPLEPLLPFEP
jgi:hypothetical protein